jgi:elongation factor G
VKNIVLLGHASSGKSTFAESMLFESKVTGQMGTIENKNTVSDYHELEVERQSSVFSSLMHTPWKGYKINIIDTPGYDDFSGEVISALRVADTGVILINASNGVEVGTELTWEYTEKFRTPTVFVMNQIDRDDADFEKSLSETKSFFSNNVVAVQYPIKLQDGSIGIIDVLSMKMHTYEKEGRMQKAVPDTEKEKAAYMHKDLVEIIAANDEGLMEKYFEKGELTEEEMKNGLHVSMIRHDIFPVFCASGKMDIGIDRIMNYIDIVCPSADEMPPQTTTSGLSLSCSSEGPACIFIFKTIVEPHIGELSLFKVYSGTINTGMELVNENTGVTEKLNQLFLMEGHNRIPVAELSAGDIGATIKLKSTHVNNTLHQKGKNLELLPILFPQSNFSIAISSVNSGDDEKLAQALHLLQEEDATVRVEVSPELKQTIINCQGELHFQIIQWKLDHIHKIVVRYEPVKISYRETIRKMVETTYRHKKQSGGSGQFAEVSMRIEPWYEGMPNPEGLNVRGQETIDLDWGGKLVFVNCIVGGAIDTRFLPAILKGVMEKMHNGPLTGSYARDIRVSVFDGKMHSVDSNDISFKIAGLQAFREGFISADPLLLEPVFLIEILCPDEVVGAVISDLQSRLGIIEGIESEGHFQKIVSKVPLYHLDHYSSTLRGLTKGKARYKMEFSNYAPVNYETQRKLAEQHSRRESEKSLAE